jgi:hypothetical protein
MNTRTIRVNINKEKALYDELISAGLNNTEYEGCYVMQWSEHRGDNYQMVAEFMLRESDH